MTTEIQYEYTDLNPAELVQAMHFHQQKATEILIRLNESPPIQVGEIPAPSWTSHCDGQGE